MKKNHTSFTLIFLFSLLSIITNAQKNQRYQAGFIVKTSGDTLKGFIEYLDWGTSPSTILFKSETSNEYQKYLADELKSFGLPEKDEYYDSKSLTLNFFRDDHKIGDSGITYSKNVNVFLRRILIAEKCSLFQMTDENKRMRLFMLKDNQFGELLYYETYYVNQNDVKSLYTNETYKSQISFITTCKNLHIKSLAYTTNKIAKILYKYNNCVNGQVLYRYKQKDFYLLDITPSIGTWVLSNVNNTKYLRYFVGLRLSFPKRFNNVFMGLGYLNSNRLTSKSQSISNFSQLSFSAGTYLGSGNIRPMIAAGLNFPLKNSFGDIFVDLGIGFKKYITLSVRGEQQPKISNSSSSDEFVKILSVNLQIAFGHIKL